MSRRRKDDSDAIAELAGGSLTDLSAEEFLQKLNTGWRPGGGTHMPGTVLRWFQDEQERRLAVHMPQAQIERDSDGKLTRESGFEIIKAMAAGQFSPGIVAQAKKAAIAAAAGHFRITPDRVAQIVRKAERTSAALERAMRERTRLESESEQRRAELARVAKRAAQRLKDPFYRGLGPLDEIADLAAGKALDSDAQLRVIELLAKALLKTP